MLRGKNFLFKDEVCCYLILQIEETYIKGTVFVES